MLFKQIFNMKFQNSFIFNSLLDEFIFIYRKELHARNGPKHTGTELVRITERQRSFALVARRHYGYSTL